MLRTVQSDVEKEDREKNGSQLDTVKRTINTKTLFTLIRKQGIFFNLYD